MLQNKSVSKQVISKNRVKQ